MSGSTTTKRYLIIGGGVYIFELLVIVIAEWSGLHAVAAIGISFWLGLLASFILQKLITFGDKRLHHKVLVPQLLAFSLLVLFNFGFTLLMAKLLAHVWPAVVIRTIALAITTIWNFYLYKTHIFVKGTTDDIIF
jgi:putative flippase GtrA